MAEASQFRYREGLMPITPFHHPGAASWPSVIR